MITNDVRWYHYLMIPFIAQIAIIIVSVVVFLLQLAIYDIFQEDVIVFSGQCDATIAPRDSDGNVTYEGVMITCGEEDRNLGALETSYLYKVLTTGEEPVIVCDKTVSEFLKEVRWHCELDPEEKEQL